VSDASNGPAGSPHGKLTIIFPVAGRDTDADFRGFEIAGGETLIHRSLRSFRPFLHLIDKLVYIVLDEHAQRFDIARRLAQQIPDVPFDLVRLSSPTSGPAETVARGVAKHGVSGKAIVCDIDHRLDLAPFFHAIATEQDEPSLVALWSLAGEDLKRWSVACVDRDEMIEEACERQLPAAAGRFFGIIGCYYFRDIESVADICLEGGHRRFSDYFNFLAARGTPARGLPLVKAEFFGDAERIRLLKEEPKKFSGTIFCDIDGTLIVHEDEPDYSRPPKLLPGSREKLRSWIAEGYCVVLCTARRKEDEPRLAEMLRELNVPYHQIVSGLPSGVRVLINDRKPYAMFTTQATSVEVARNQGIASLEIEPPRQPMVLRRFEGGSFAETLLIEEGDRTFVRKRVAKDCNLSAGYHRLRDQFRTLERFSQLSAGLVPALYSEENNSHEYFYDMQFLSEHVQLAECDGATQAMALDRLFDRVQSDLYCHRSNNAGAAEDWFLRHLQSKIYPKIEALSAHDALRPLLKGDGVEIDGEWQPALAGLLAQVRQEGVLQKLLPRILSLVHGDLTFQNVMVRPDGDVKVIDMEAQDTLEAIELDLGKIFQSIHSQYETWSQVRTPLCTRTNPAKIALNFAPVPPDAALLDVIQRRWSAILDCPDDVVDMKGQFYLGLHLVRMVPFRLKTSVDHALYALSTGLVFLSRAIETASIRRAPRRSIKRAA
jgi:hypothetical protein